MSLSRTHYQIIQSDVDILCLQEVWTADVQRKIRRDLKPFYPYALSAIDLDMPPADTTPLTCPQDGLQEFFNCRALRCAEQTGFAFVICGILRYLYCVTNRIISLFGGFFIER